MEEMEKWCHASLAHAVVVGVAALLTAWNSRDNGFVWDDRAAIVGNKDVDANMSHWWQLFHHDFWGSAINTTTSHKSYRPLTVLTFRWDHSLHGLDPRGFHTTNVMIHALCSVLVWQTACVVLGKQKNFEVGTFLAGLLFAVHPIHCDSVASIVGRADLLCVMCSLGGFHLYNIAERRNSWKFTLAAIVLGICACLCKELGITVFGIYIAHTIINALAYDEVRLSDLPQRRMRVVTVIVSAIGLLIIRLWVNGEQTKATFNILANSINVEDRRHVRILSYAHIHAWYLWKLVWPSWLSYDYGFNTIPVITSATDPRNLLTVFAYAVVITSIFKGYRDIKRSPLLLCIAFGVIPFVPAANIFFPVGTVVAERLLYFPSVGFSLLIGFVANEFVATLIRVEDRIATVTEKSRAASSFGRTVRCICVASIVIILAASMSKSVVRNTDWKTEETLFVAAVDVVPENIKVLNNAAKVLLNKDPERALQLARASVAYMTQHVEGQGNLGLALTIQPNTILAIRHMAKAFAFSAHEAAGAGYAGTHLYDHWIKQHNGTVTVERMMRSATVKLALDFLDKAIQRGSHMPVHYYQRGVISEQLNDLPTAIRYMEAAKRMNERIVQLGLDTEMVLEPGPLHNHIAVLRRHMGNDDDALVELLAGMDLYPTEPTLYFNSAAIYVTRKQLNWATHILERCLRLCENADRILDGARLLEHLGQQEAAKVFSEHAMKMHARLA